MLTHCEASFKRQRSTSQSLRWKRKLLVCTWHLTAFENTNWWNREPSRQLREDDPGATALCRKGGSLSNITGAYRAVSLTAAGEQLCCWMAGKGVFSKSEDLGLDEVLLWLSLFSVAAFCYRWWGPCGTDARSASPDGGMPWSPTSIPCLFDFAGASAIAYLQQGINGISFTALYDEFPSSSLLPRAFFILRDYLFTLVSI